MWKPLARVPARFEITTSPLVPEAYAGAIATIIFIITSGIVIIHAYDSIKYGISLTNFHQNNAQKSRELEPQHETVKIYTGWMINNGA